MVVTYLGSLVQSCCGEGRTLQTNITGMCGECSQCFSCSGFAPTHSVWAFIVYTTQAPGCSAGNGLRWALGCVHFPGLSRSGSGSPVLHKGADLVGPVFCALPRSKQLRWLGAWRAQSPPGRGYVLLPLPSQLLSFLGVQWVHLLRCAVCLFWGADLWLWPSQQMSTVQNPKKSWLAMKAAHSLVEDASLGPWFPLHGYGYKLPLPACLRWGMGRSAAC